MTGQRFVRAMAASALGILQAVLPQLTAAQSIDSVYTTYDWQQDCTRADDPPAENEPQMGAKFVCPGPVGMSLMLADGDARMSLDYGVVPHFGPWESFSSFNEVHNTVEWRRTILEGRMVPFATIHRWTVWMGEVEREMLVISTVAAEAERESCIVAVIDANRTAQANELARQVADIYAPDVICGDTPVRAFGNVDLDIPLPRRVAAQ